MHGLAGIARGPGDVKAVALRHRLKFFERANLLAQFLPVANDLFGGHNGIERGLLGLLLLHQSSYAIEWHAPVISDDASAAVGIGQAGKDVRTAAGADVRGIGVKDPFVVCFAILRERLDDSRTRLEAVGFQGIEDHAQAAVRHDRSFQRRFGLQADDHLIVLVDVAGSVGGDGTRDQGDVEDALLALFDKQFLELFPNVSRPLGRGGEERIVPLIRRVVVLEEPADIDVALPEPGLESTPGVFRL